MQRILPRCSASLLRPSTASVLRATRIVERSINSTQNTINPARLVSRSFHQITRLCQEAATAQADTAQDEDGLASTFAELGERKLVNQRFIDTLTKSMQIHTMTDVQKATINTALAGKDIIAQAKTGTGKTLAFLLPIMQNVVNEDPSLQEPRRRYDGRKASGHDIRAIIISPTRELAEQIAVEAHNLVRGTSIVVQTAVGGSFKREGLRKIKEQGCHVLVGTPGRLMDIFTDQYSGISAPALNTLVLDEADRLLETGFAEDIKNITAELPSPQERPRQTMLFSATVPKEVVRLVRTLLKPGFEFVQCVKDGEEPTHERVPQNYVEVNGFENKIPALLELLAREAKASQEADSRPFKAIVYFNSTAEVQMYTKVLQDIARQPSRIFGAARVFGVQSRLTQVQRTRETLGFRRCQSGILVSSDVTARGLDFPDVTHVIQLANPPSREQYVHRIGRTGRAGKEGRGYLILSTTEMRRAQATLGGLPLVPDETFETSKLDLTQEADVSPQTGQILSTMQNAFGVLDPEFKSDAYKALLGVHEADFSRNKRGLISVMNRLARYNWGMTEPPSISPALAKRMGIDRIEGVNTSAPPRSFGGGRFGEERSGEPRFGEGQFGQARFGEGRRDDARDSRHDDPDRVDHSALDRVLGPSRSGGGGRFSSGRSFDRAGSGFGNRDRGSQGRGGYGSGPGRQGGESRRGGGYGGGGFRSDRGGSGSRFGGGDRGRY